MLVETLEGSSCREVGLGLVELLAATRMGLKTLQFQGTVEARTLEHDMLQPQSLKGKPP